MNPKHEINLSNVRIYADGKEIGELKNISASAEVEYTNDNKSNSYFNYKKSFNITLENASIRSELMFLKELIHIQQVLKYVKHSKKKERAVKKRLEIIKEINKH